MPFQKSETGKFFTIMNGKFAVRVPEGTEGAVSRVNKLGKTVHEIFHDSFTAVLVGIRTQDGEYGKNWIFQFNDGGDIWNLQLSYSNSYATNLLKMLPNIDLTREFKMQPAVKEEDGKTKSSLFIKQDGNSVKHAYTMENPNGLPPMEEKEVRGQKVWDDTKRLEFLHDMVKRDIIPKLPQASTPEAQSGLAVDAAPAQGAGDEDDW